MNAYLGSRLRRVDIVTAVSAGPLHSGNSPSASSEKWEPVFGETTLSV